MSLRTELERVHAVYETLGDPARYAEERLLAIHAVMLGGDPSQKMSARAATLHKATSLRLSPRDLSSEGGAIYRRVAHITDAIQQKANTRDSAPGLYSVILRAAAHYTNPQTVPRERMLLGRSITSMVLLFIARCEAADAERMAELEESTQTLHTTDPFSPAYKGAEVNIVSLRDYADKKAKEKTL